jgi:hypothetical protein
MLLGVGRVLRKRWNDEEEEEEVVFDFTMALLMIRAGVNCLLLLRVSVYNWFTAGFRYCFFMRY